ncbi:MAG: cysteine desulfurase NifS [Chloroflexota bacterium]
MDRLIYFDHAATTPVDPRVVSAMLPYFTEEWGNPSSVYEHGQRARRALDEARDTVASVLGARPNEITFTSCGSESDNLAIKGVAMALQDRGRHIITSSVEHHAVLHTCSWLEKYQSFSVTYLKVDRHGLVDLDELRSAIRPETTLISIMLANNEIGTIQPMAEITRIARERAVTVHTDAVQAGGALPLNVDALGVDLLSLSGHKLNAPKGVGILYMRRGTKLVSQMQGGGQERGLRAGTENVPYAVAMAAAIKLAREELESRTTHARRLRDRLIEGVLARISGSQLTGHPTERMPNSASFVFEGTDGESMLLNLDEHGICASSGSACTAGSIEISHVLQALGLPDRLAQGSLRLTTGAHNTDAEVDIVLDVLPDVVERVRQIAPALSI